MAAPFPVMRRIRFALAATALCVALSACSDVGTISGTSTDIGKLGVLLWHQIGGIGSSTSVPRERAAAIPYASIGVRLGDSDESMFVLANKSGTDLMWLGGTKIGITTRHGRIVRTVGFASNVSGVHAAQGVDEGLTQPSAGFLYDFAEQSRYGIPVKCTRSNLGPEKVMIIGVSRDTTHVAEDCNAAEMDWNFRNEFWVDQTGFVWKSRQFVESRLDPITFEVFRPAAE